MMSSGVNKGDEGFPTTFRREKTIGRIVEEISFFKERYRLHLIRFQDETFLSMKTEKLKELSKTYEKHVGLPFIIEATIPSLSEEKLFYLKNMGCVSLSLGLESGSLEMRKFLKKPHITNDKILEKLKQVKNFISTKYIQWILVVFVFSLLQLIWQNT